MIAPNILSFVEIQFLLRNGRCPQCDGGIDYMRDWLTGGEVLTCIPCKWEISRKQLEEHNAR